MSAPAWVVLGAGYVGARLVDALVADGIAVTGTRASAAGAARVDIDRDDVGPLIPAGAVVVDSVPPTPGGPEAQRRVVRAAAAAGAARLIYLSSTGVYPSGVGAVDEDTPPAPDRPRGVARLACEQAVRDESARVGLDAVVLRLAGIYGPDRDLVARLRAGTLRLGPDADALVNRVHVDDVVAAIRLVGAGPLPHDVLDVADGHPAPTREVALVLAAALGLPLPPTHDAPSPHGSGRAITAARLRALGWRPRYPSWREGMLPR